MAGAYFRQGKQKDAFMYFRVAKLAAVLLTSAAAAAFGLPTALKKWYIALEKVQISTRETKKGGAEQMPWQVQQLPNRITG